MPNRMLREGILDSDRIDKLDWPEEVFYRRLMSKVDDYGLFDARPAILRTTLYPLRVDRVREADIARWIAACEMAGVIALYVHGGKPYGQMLDTKWQARSEPKHPLPPWGKGAPPPASVRGPPSDANSPPSAENSCAQMFAPAPVDVDVDVLPPNPPQAGGKKRGVRRCPEDFEVTSAMRGWAASEVPGVDIDRETRSFRDFEFSRAYTDWPATWRNWMRRAADRAPRAGGAPQGATRPWDGAI